MQGSPKAALPSGGRRGKENALTGEAPRPVGGAPRSGPTPTHQGRPCGPVGRRPRASSSGPAAGHGARWLTPSLPPPGLNLSLQAAAPESHAASAAAFESGLAAALHKPTGAPAPASANHQPPPRTRARARACARGPEREAPPGASKRRAREAARRRPHAPSVAPPRPGEVQRGGAGGPRRQPPVRRQPPTATPPSVLTGPCAPATSPALLGRRLAAPPGRAFSSPFSSELRRTSRRC